MSCADTLSCLFTQPEPLVCIFTNNKQHPGPVVQNIVSLTSSLVVKILTVIVSTISNSHVFLLKKCE